ncbi:MAG: sterol desaturase family protein [Moraxellaceae bacterium]|nr:sterol desaturase family protein [Moraxellaceae bacterium]
MTDYLRRNLEEVDLTPGRGRVSGSLSVGLGLLGIMGALCFLFPDLLTTPDFQPLYNATVLRQVLFGGIGFAFVFGFYSVMQGHSRWLGLVGLALSSVAAVLGSMETERALPAERSLYAGLDYFVLTLLVLALVFIPLERLFPKSPEQKTLRAGWTTDLKYFLFSHLGVQIISFFTVIPAQHFFAWLIDADFQRLIASQPVWLQFIEILVVVDFTTYWMHRSMHEVPWLWKIHAVHHSTLQMDWLASSRIHFLEIVSNRLLGYLPIFILGFTPAAVYAYLVFVSFHAIFIHANVRFRFPVIRHLLATPEFHHWHHTSQDEGVDINYAGFLPIYDRLFGTYYLPANLPERYGTRGAPLPEGFTDQFLYPFRQWQEMRAARKPDDSASH